MPVKHLTTLLLMQQEYFKPALFIFLGRLGALQQAADITFVTLNSSEETRTQGSGPRHRGKSRINSVVLKIKLKSTLV